MTAQTEEWSAFARRLPIQLAIRLAVDSISYSNPLPDWIETAEISYSRRGHTIRSKIVEYLNGAKPKAAFAVDVPRKSNRSKKWMVPTVNDQIILQACVSSMAEKVYSESVNRSRVFSYRYNTDANRLALTEDAVRSWADFQNETRRRCASNECILQIDIANAFASIPRPRFLEFLSRRAPDPLAVHLLGKLLDGFSPAEKGLPLINDSLFFLGNAHLSEIDSIVESHTSEFIRFVDDYRIFGSSRADLSTKVERIGSELSRLGYEINSDKLRLGSGQEYLDAASDLRYSTSTGLARQTPQGSRYIDAAIFTDLIQPRDLVNLIVKSVQNPDEYLNEGLGRLQLAALKKLRINASISDDRNYISSTRDDFLKELSANPDVARGVTNLLGTYLHEPSEVWRSIWLLYLSQEIQASGIPEQEIAGKLKSALFAVREAKDVPTVVKLWAHAPFASIGEEAFEKLGACEYVECGTILAAGRSS